LRAELTNLVLAIKQRNHEGTSGRLGKYDEFRQKWIKKTAIPMNESGKLITEADLKFLKLPSDRLLNPAQKKELDKWMEFKNKGKDKTPAAEKELRRVTSVIRQGSTIIYLSKQRMLVSYKDTGVYVPHLLWKVTTCMLEQ
jgi:hypothetical protein